MRLTRVVTCVCALLAWTAQVGADSSLSQDELKLLQDPGGWEYISISQPNGGVQTTHTCFDGVPHPEQCSGTLLLAANNSFVKSIHVQGGTDQRHGTYQLDGSQISFVDELGEKDGPYDLSLDPKAKSLVLQMQGLRMELELEKAYRDNQKKAK